MIQTGSRGRSTKAFEFNRGGDAMEYVFAGSLAVVIIGALGLTIYFTFIKSNTPGPAVQEGMYKCTKCQAEFSVDPATRQKLEERDDPRADCPKCGKARSAYPMVKCFACNKYFIKPSLLKRGAKDICPYCGKDYLQGISEYVRSHPAK